MNQVYIHITGTECEYLRYEVLNVYTYEPNVNILHVLNTYTLYVLNVYINRVPYMDQMYISYWYSM